MTSNLNTPERRHGKHEEPVRLLHAAQRLEMKLFERVGATSKA